MSDTTERTKLLFAAAKTDGPSDASREAMWAGIQLSALPFAPQSAPSTHLAVKAIASSKLALGIALGASITVGVAGAVLVMTRPPAAPAAHVAEPRVLEREDMVVRLPAPVLITGHAASDAPSTSMELDTVPAPAKHAAPARAISERDRLAQEARMVSEARGALHRGEPQTALRIVRAARSQRGARLVPEELTVEAQALRAMGDEAGAARAEAELAGKFPGQDLAQ